MTTETIDMRSLLEQAGFKLRGATRADCLHCDGGSLSTVSFTSELAFCHRCKWRANTVTLARELGLLSGNHKVALVLREGARERRLANAELEPFDAWREDCIRHVSDRYYSLSRAAIRAGEVLSKFPECEAAWDALARFYHAEGRLLATLDWLMFAKASVWLEEDSTPAEVFATWRDHAA
ncbi:MAG: hypothetical protein WBF09_15135 [Candidatus Acidiferrum sp.]